MTEPQQIAQPPEAGPQPAVPAVSPTEASPERTPEPTAEQAPAAPLAPPAPAVPVAGRRTARLHQPVRAVVAGVEVVLAVVAVVAAVWCWNHGIVRYEFPFDGGAPLVATRYFGNWIAAAVGLVAAAAVLVLDALRQLVLAVRVRRGTVHF